MAPPRCVFVTDAMSLFTPLRFRTDSLVEYGRAVLGFEHVTVFVLRVVELVHRELRVHELEVLRLLEGVADLLRVGAAGARYRVGEPVDGVVGHDCVHEFLALGSGLLLILVEEVLQRGVFLRDVADPEGVLHSFRSGYLPEVVAVAVAADDRDGDAELAGLLDGERRAFAHRRKDDDVGIGFLNLRELRAEVDVFAAVAFVGYDLAALGLEALNEEFAESVRVVARYVVEDAGRLSLEVLGREGGEDGSLIGVEEADTEVVGADLSLFVYRNLRVGGQGAYVGDLAAVEYRRGRYAEAGAARAYRRDYLVLLDEAARRVDHVFVSRAAVVHDDFELLAEDAALGVDFGNGHLDRFDFRDAVGREVAGDGRYFTNFDCVGGKSGECKQHYQ